MARDVISSVACNIRGVDSASSIEEITRYVVAQVMEDEDRLLEEDEVLEIAEDVVRGEDIPVVEETLEDGVARMTDIEWENVPDERKVVDTDGDSAVIIEGKVVKVELTESKKAERIAEKIAGEMLAFFNLFQQVNGSDMNFSAYHSATAERDYSCPKCGSYEVDAIWYDDEDVLLECADCKHGWAEKIVPEAERVESVTAEEYPIAFDDEEELIGEVYFDSDEQKFCVEIYENGESVHTEYFDSSDGVYDLIDALGEAFESISEDVVLKDTETGETEIVELVDGDVETSARTASRGRIAVEIATGKKVADYSNVFMDKVYAGDVYKDARGNEIEVVSSDSDVTYIFSNWDESLEDYRNEYRAMGKQAFLQFVADNGYERK